MSTSASNASAAPSETDTIFLSLAPVSSSNYPTTPPGPTASDAAAASRATAVVSPAEALASPVVAPVDLALAASTKRKERRSSSVSSNSSSGAPFRFLKLGPVHFGGVQGGTDFAEADE